MGIKSIPFIQLSLKPVLLSFSFIILNPKKAQNLKTRECIVFSTHMGKNTIKHMAKNTMEDIKMEKVLLDEVRELAIELCLGGEIEQRRKCISDALLWDNDKIAEYILNALSDSDKKYYLRNTQLYNAMFRTALRDEDNYIRGW